MKNLPKSILLAVIHILQKYTQYDELDQTVGLWSYNIATVHVLTFLIVNLRPSVEKDETTDRKC